MFSSRVVLGIGYRAFGIDFVSSALSWLPPQVLIPTLRRHGASIGSNLIHKDAWLIDNAVVDYRNLKIGNNCYVGKAVLFDIPNRIVLEDEVVVSARATFLTHADTGSRIMSHWYPRREGPIRIGRGTWIGAGAIIFPAVELGECCVVGAGAVVTHSWPARSVIVGVPAKLVKDLPAIDSSVDQVRN
jgi:maltose O-acetyltransferase